MIKNIDGLLQARADISPYFVHFIHGETEAESRQSMLNILYERTLEARSGFGMARGIYEKYSEELCAASLDQKCCCFTETPPDHWPMMIEEMPGRARKFRPFGLVFSRKVGISLGFNPVWYLNTTEGVDWLTAPIDEMVASCMRHLDDGGGINYKADGGKKVLSPPRFEVLRITPFIEQFGYTSFSGKDFSWEREWRLVGDLNVNPRNLTAVLAPEREHASIRDEIAEFPGWKKSGLPIMDPSWGREKIITTLSA